MNAGDVESLNPLLRFAATPWLLSQNLRYSILKGWALTGRIRPKKMVDTFFVSVATSYAISETIYAVD
jgi:hypothetical protein